MVAVALAKIVLAVRLGGNTRGCTSSEVLFARTVRAAGPDSSSTANPPETSLQARPALALCASLADTSANAVSGQENRNSSGDSQRSRACDEAVKDKRAGRSSPSVDRIIGPMPFASGSQRSVSSPGTPARCMCTSACRVPVLALALDSRSRSTSKSATARAAPGSGAERLFMTSADSPQDRSTRYPSRSPRRYDRRPAERTRTHPCETGRP